LTVVVKISQLLTESLDLSALITDPKHQRRGAGSMLIKWGTDIADAAGIECCLEATETGRPLYERHGFEVARELPVEAEKYGVENIDTFVVSTHRKGARNAADLFCNQGNGPPSEASHFSELQSIGISKGHLKALVYKGFA